MSTTRDDEDWGWDQPLPEPIKLELTGKLRKQLLLDFEEVAPENMLGCFEEYNTRVVLKNKGQARCLYTQLNQAALLEEEENPIGDRLAVRTAYSNPQVSAAASKKKDELLNELEESGVQVDRK